MKCDNSPKERAHRLSTKVLGSPFVPVLAYGKLIEGLVAMGPVVPWAVVSAAATVGYVYGEDTLEAVARGDWDWADED